MLSQIEIEFLKFRSALARIIERRLSIAYERRCECCRESLRFLMVRNS